RPGVTHEIERIELPWVEGADTNNYMVWSVSPDLDQPFVDLVADQEAANGQRVTANGFQVVYAPDSNIPEGKLPKFRVRFTQSVNAQQFLVVRGNPIAYIASRPSVVNQVRTVLDVTSGLRADAYEQAERLTAMLSRK